MEVEKEQIIKKLETEVTKVWEYDEMIKYFINLNENIQGIWKKLESQQHEIPRTIFIKKSEINFELDKIKKELRKEQRAEYIKTLENISTLKNNYETNLLINNIENYEKNYEIFSNLNYEIEQMIKRCAQLNEYQTILELKLTDFSEIKDIYNQFINYYNLWDAVYKFEFSKISWMNDPLKKINRKDLKNTYDYCTGILEKLEKNVFRRDKPNPYNVIQQIKERIKEFQPYLPVLYDLINPDLK